MITYKDAGVDIDKGNEIVDRIKRVTETTNRQPHLLGSMGGFSAAFEIPKGYTHPVIVTTTDGVGTKIRLVTRLNKPLENVGIDLVAMCVNDIITCGAEPIAFLDYYGTSKLDVDVAEKVIANIAHSCFSIGCPLVGGETAELPGVYAHTDTVELAGFCVGVVEKSEMITGEQIQPGDALIGIPSSGFHSNGYSLLNRLITEKCINFNQMIESGYPRRQMSLYDALVQPTPIYVSLIRELIEMFDVRGIANITGGGIPENVPRMIPKHLKPIINWNRIELPELFKWVQTEADLDTKELRRTFNCGFGIVLCVAGRQTIDVLEYLRNDLDVVDAQVIGFIGVK